MSNDEVLLHSRNEAGERRNRRSILVRLKQDEGVKVGEAGSKQTRRRHLRSKYRLRTSHAPPLSPVSEVRGRSTGGR